MESELGRVVDALPGLVWTALPDGRSDFFNQRWRDYTGLSFDEALGEGWFATIHPDDLPDVLERWNAMLESGQPGEVEGRVRRFDGSYRWFHFSAAPIADDTGRIVKWCGINTEIEDRRRAEEALRVREGHYRDIADSIPAQISFMTPTGEVEMVNRHVLDYFGATLADLQGWATGEAVHPDDLPAVVAAWRRAVATGEPYETEHRLRRADGAYLWFYARGLPLWDSVGRVARWYVLQTSIDDRKRAEALLAGEKLLFEMVALGRPATAILETLCSVVDSSAEGCLAGVLLFDDAGAKVEQALGSSLPREYSASLEGCLVTREAGPCGMAAVLKAPVIVSDVRSDPRWDPEGWPAQALAHGLNSCWSTPILSSAGAVLGTFAIYRRDGGGPTLLHIDLIQKLSHIASIAIERSQSDAALKRSEARKAAILDSALDCIVTIDGEGRITEFNPAAERTFGFRRQDVVGKPLTEVIIPRSLRKKHRRGLARYLATGEARAIGKRVEMVAVHADGHEFPVEIAITRNPLDGPPSFTGYLRDITERKLAEEDLRRSEAFLAETRRLSSTGGFSKQVATGEIVWSEEVYRMFELDPAVPATLDLILSRVHPEDVSSFEEMLSLQRRGRDYEHEYRLLMPDRSIKHLHVVAHASRDPEGPLEYIAAVQDVTQRRLSEEALAKARSDLARVARISSLGALTASIAHEVNQPLSGIITNASTCLRMLAADPPNVAGALETARRTIRDGNRAADVITRLRALFAKQETATETVNLNEAAQEVIALALSELQRNRVVLRSDLERACRSSMAIASSCSRSS